MKFPVRIPVITGPTASGKTSFAVSLASRFNGEIISVDSRQIYRGMDLGTGKDLEEYGNVPYHLIDIADPGEEYNLAYFMRDCHQAVSDICSRGRLPVLCGGTALYLDAILRNYTLEGGAPDPEKRNDLRGKESAALLEILKSLEPDSPILLREPNNRTRIIRRIEQLQEHPDEKLLEQANISEFPCEFLIFGVYRNRTELRRRIEERLNSRIEAGMLEEGKRLHEEGVSYGRMEFFGLEYRYMARYLQGQLSLEEMREQLLNKIRQFAKRQDSWFRYMERKGLNIYWLDPNSFSEADALLEQFLKGESLPEPEMRLSQILYPRHP